MIDFTTKPVAVQLLAFAVFMFGLPVLAGAALVWAVRGSAWLFGTLT